MTVWLGELCRPLRAAGTCGVCCSLTGQALLLGWRLIQELCEGEQAQCVSSAVAGEGMGRAQSTMESILS